MTVVTTAELPEVARRARRDIEIAALALQPGDIRYMVDTYYQIQEYRKAARNQERSAEEEPNAAVSWIADTMELTESTIKRLLDVYTDHLATGRWAKSQYGIGPVITAGLLAHIDIEKAPTVGHIWRFAGLDPTIIWNKGQKRPYNHDLKVLCWKIGDSFCKFHNHPACYYGHVYAERKQQEVQRNAEGLFAAQAAATLATRKIKDKGTRATYEAGRLPDGRLELRARRYAVKLFLSHLHWVMYEDRYGVPPPRPYVVEYLGHAHLLRPPGWPM